MADRQGKGFYTSPSASKCSPCLRAEFQRPRDRRYSQGQTPLALHSYLGYIHCWNVRCTLLPAHSHRKPWIYDNCPGSASEFAHLASEPCRHCCNRLSRRQCTPAASTISSRCFRGGAGLLRSPRGLPVQRSRLRGHSDWKRLHGGLLPADVALARANDFASHGIRVQHRLRQQLRPDRRRHWASDFPAKIRATVSGELC